MGKTPIIPLSFKILGIFTCLLLLSNFTTNIINILLNQHEIISLNNNIMVGQLKDLYTASSNQYEIYSFSQDKQSTQDAMRQVAERSFTKKNTLAIAADGAGFVSFSISAAGEKYDVFPDMDTMRILREAKEKGIFEGSIEFKANKGDYFGVYKYHPDWDYYLIWAELRSEVQSASIKVFGLIALSILILIILFLWVGLVIFSRMLAPIKKMIRSLYVMQESQNLSLLDLEGASNDDISYLGASFNALSSTINNILMIFQKFVSRDLVDRAYEEGIILLDGHQRDLTIMFSDIRHFTFMTEVMGNDIINLLNIHYDRAIETIYDHGGIIGSIIGDALLAVYGVAEKDENKSIQALEAAMNLIDETDELREILKKRKAQILKTRSLNAAEEKVFKAVLLDIGVGLDGGHVFYGNIGSKQHMTNTVIGDNVNSASRLEGLTRVYSLPIIVSEYIKTEVELESEKYRFVEIDTVQVKGKTERKKIFAPIEIEKTSKKTLKKYDIFEEALQLYYSGEWKKAKPLFESAALGVSQVFVERIGSNKVPKGWKGIWTMETK